MDLYGVVNNGKVEASEYHLMTPIYGCLKDLMVRYNYMRPHRTYTISMVPHMHCKK